MSFSSEVKNMLSGLQVKKPCCRKALLYGLLCSHSDFDSHSLVFATDNEKVCALFSWVFRQVYSITPEYETVTAVSGTISYFKIKPLTPENESRVIDDLTAEDLLRCDNCLAAFLRGLFLTGGTVSDPTKKGYHLEIIFKSEDLCEEVFILLDEQGFMPKQTKRRGSLAIYFKNSERIEDFLTVIGAPHAALELMNAKILRDIRNNENRRSNCDASNIYRSTGAADVHLRAIKKLMDNGKFSLLPAELQTTALIRYNNPECSLLEIAALHEPPLTKSGVNHRLKRIVAFANEE